MVHVDSSSLGIGIDRRGARKKRVTGKSCACTQGRDVLVGRLCAKHLCAMTQNMVRTRV